MGATTRHSAYTHRREEVCEHEQAVQADVVVAEPEAAYLQPLAVASVGSCRRLQRRMRGREGMRAYIGAAFEFCEYGGDVTAADAAALKTETRWKWVRLASDAGSTGSFRRTLVPSASARLPAHPQNAAAAGLGHGMQLARVRPPPRARRVAGGTTCSRRRCPAPPAAPRAASRRRSAAPGGGGLR